jgi:hypothetical protein
MCSTSPSTKLSITVYKSDLNVKEESEWVSPFEQNHFFAKLVGTDSVFDIIFLICVDSQ